jgi:hypothetical protein
MCAFIYACQPRNIPELYAGKSIFCLSLCTNFLHAAKVQVKLNVSVNKHKFHEGKCAVRPQRDKHVERINFRSLFRVLENNILGSLWCSVPAQLWKKEKQKNAIEFYHIKWC